MPNLKLSDDRGRSPKARKGQKSSTVINLLIMMIFLGTLLLGLAVYTLGDDREISHVEGRELAQKPDFSFTSLFEGDYTEQFETYTNDQVFQRDRWVYINGFVRKNGLLQPLSNGIYGLPSGMLLEPAEKVQNFDGFKEPFGQFSNDMKQAEVPVWFASAPSKASFADAQGLIPSHIPSYNDESRKVMHGVLGEVGIEVIDLYDSLKENDIEDVYFKTDHHWSINGAYVGYEQIMSTLQQEFPELETLPKEHWESKSMTTPYYGTYARKASLPYVKSADYLEYWEPTEGFNSQVCMSFESCNREVIDRNELEKTDPFEDYYGVFMGGNYSHLKIEQKRKTNDRHIVVLKDSYANPLLGLLAESVGEITVFDVRYTKDIDISEYIVEEDVDGVMFMHNDVISGLAEDYSNSF